MQLTPRAVCAPMSAPPAESPVTAIRGGLVLLRVATARNPTDRVIPVGAVALSPVTDLTLSGESWRHGRRLTRISPNPRFSNWSAAIWVELTPQLRGLPHSTMTCLDWRRSACMGDDEVLLSDALRYVACRRLLYARIPFIPLIFPVAAVAGSNGSEAIDKLNPHNIFRHFVAKLTLDADADRRTIGDRQC
jgi:hypothetical protein